MLRSGTSGSTANASDNPFVSAAGRTRSRQASPIWRRVTGSICNSTRSFSISDRSSTQWIICSRCCPAVSIASTRIVCLGFSPPSSPSNWA